MIIDDADYITNNNVIVLLRESFADLPYNTVNYTRLGYMCNPSAPWIRVPVNFEDGDYFVFITSGSGVINNWSKVYYEVNTDEKEYAIWRQE